MCDIQIIYLLHVLSLDSKSILPSAQQDEHLWRSCQTYMKVRVWKFFFLFVVKAALCQAAGIFLYLM